MAHSESIFCFFCISFTIEGIKVLGEQILEKCQMTALRSGRQRCGSAMLRDR